MPTITGLSSNFQTLIEASMQLERNQRLARLETQKSTLTSQKSLYSSLQTRFSELQRLTQALISKDGSYAVKAGKISTINPYGDKAVVSASLTSSAVAGEYSIAVNRLATSHQVRGTQQGSADTALGLSGDFFIGGRRDTQGPEVIENSRDANVISAVFSTVADTTAAGAIDSGKKQLGSGDYRVEVRKESGVWQFRLVDEDSGKAVAIREGTDTETHTSDWQTITAGEYDTGRGLKITFADPSTYSDDYEGVAGELTYNAQGAKVSISTTDSLNEIASKINSASFADGNEVVASVIDQRLVLTSKYTGRAMVASEVDANNVLRTLGILDTAGSGTFETFVAANETVAQTAQFSVNGITMTRRVNSGLTNVVSGMTLSLSGKHDDWTTQSDTLTISETMEGATGAVQSFLDKFNEMLLFLEENTGITKIAENQYTRGGLADDTIFSDLRTQLFSLFSSEMDATYQRANQPDGSAGDLITLGLYRSLRQIGITLDDNLSASISDETALTDALTNNRDEVEALFDAIMGSIDDNLGRFTGVWGDYGNRTDSYINSSVQNLTTRINEVTDDIEDEEVRLDAKEASLIQQYAQLQTQLLNLQYMQQTWSAIYGTASTLY